MTVDMLERVEMETMYVIEVEKSKQEFSLFYAEDGTLIKAVEDIDNNDYYQPNTVPEVLKNFINNNYPQSHDRGILKSKRELPKSTSYTITKQKNYTSITLMNGYTQLGMLKKERFRK